MSKLYYNPIDLPEQPVEKKTADPTAEAWPSVEKFSLVNDRVAKELNAIQNGTSELVAYARYFNATEPVMVRFQALKTDPTKKNWVSFMILVEQDLGRKAADQIEKWYSLIFTGNVSYKEEQ